MVSNPLSDQELLRQALSILGADRLAREFQLSPTTVAKTWPKRLRDTGALPRRVRPILERLIAGLPPQSPVVLLRPRRAAALLAAIESELRSGHYGGLSGRDADEIDEHLTRQVRLLLKGARQAKRRRRG